MVNSYDLRIQPDGLKGWKGRLFRPGHTVIYTTTDLDNLLEGMKEEIIRDLYQQGPKGADHAE